MLPLMKGHHQEDPDVAWMAAQEEESWELSCPSALSCRSWWQPSRKLAKKCKIFPPEELHFICGTITTITCFPAVGLFQFVTMTEWISVTKTMGAEGRSWTTKKQTKNIDIVLSLSQHCRCLWWKPLYLYMSSRFINCFMGVRKLQSCTFHVGVRCALRWFIWQLLVSLSKSEHAICMGVKYVECGQPFCVTEPCTVATVAIKGLRWHSLNSGDS